jgi:hypothetical protein
MMSKQLSRKEENDFLRAIGEPVEDDIRIDTIDEIIITLETTTINSNSPKYVEGYDYAIKIIKSMRRG